MTLALIAVGALGAVLAGYAVFLAGHPDRSCRWCQGEGCRFCGRTGRKPRLGTRAVRRVASWWRGPRERGM